MAKAIDFNVPFQTGAADAASRAQATGGYSLRIDELPSLRERVYDKLRDAIISGRLAPGERVKERELAAYMHISTTPVKEALRRLEQEGLIITRSRRGTTVSDVALTSVEEIAETRSALESLGARFAAAKMSTSEIDQLSGLLERMKAYTASRDLDNLVAANTEFHRRIREGSGNYFICRFVDTLAPFDRSIRQRALSYPDEARRGYDEHASILSAIVRRAGARAERSMRDHILRTARFVLSRRGHGEPSVDGDKGQPRGIARTKRGKNAP